MELALLSVNAAPITKPRITALENGTDAALPVYDSMLNSWQAFVSSRRTAHLRHLQ